MIGEPEMYADADNAKYIWKVLLAFWNLAKAEILCFD